jgi:tetratricopeptide (TPR) repeat protein
MLCITLKKKEAGRLNASGSGARGQTLRFSLICFFIALCVGTLYFNSLGNQFTNWDDSMIYANPQIRSLAWANLCKIFSLEKAANFQPIRILSYAVDYHFWKLDSLGYHITSIFFYMLTCIMIFFTLRHLSASLREKASPGSHERVALFASLIFAAHPVHVEAVTWLAARKEVLQGFFFFLGFYLYLKVRKIAGRQRMVYLGMVLFAMLLAILSKPSAVVFPAVILVYEIAQRQNKWIDFIRNHRIFLAILVLISIIFASILIKVMWEAGGVKPYRGGSFFNNLLISFTIFIYNIILLIFTINYSAAYTIPISNPVLSLQTSIFVGVTLLLFGLSLWSLKKTKVFFFSFFFFFVTLTPFLNIIPISTLLADRYVFISSLSSCFLLGIAFDILYNQRMKRFSASFFKLLSIAIFLFLLAGYSYMTMNQNKIWRNSYTLWTDAVEKYPDSNTANALMGVVYMDSGMDEKAADYLEKAVHILPYDYHSRNNLGIVYGRLEQPEKALKELMTAIWLKPEDDSIKVNLGVFYQRQKEYTKAEEVLNYLLSKNPKDAQLHFRLGMVYKDAGRYEEAVSELLKSMKLAPHIINPYEELGNIYASKFKDFEKATYYYGKGIEAAPKARSRVEDLRWMIQDLEHHR